MISRRLFLKILGVLSFIPFLPKIQTDEERDERHITYFQPLRVDDLEFIDYRTAGFETEKYWFSRSGKEGKYMYFLEDK